MRKRKTLLVGTEVLAVDEVERFLVLLKKATARVAVACRALEVVVDDTLVVRKVEGGRSKW